MMKEVLDFTAFSKIKGDRYEVRRLNSLAKHLEEQ